MGVIENMREVADLVKKIGDMELNRKIVNLEGEVHDLSRAKRQLELKVEEQDRVIHLTKEMKHKPPFHFIEGDPIPFCSPCWETKKLQVHVIFSHDNDHETRWDCPTCKQMFLFQKDRPRPSHLSPANFGEHGWMAR
jgi:hypothetical protein